MHLTNHTDYYAQLFLTGLLLIFFFNTSHAAKIKAISIEESVQINFGTIAADNGICTMQSGGTLSGSAGQFCSGIETPAEFIVGGTNGQIIELMVTGGSNLGVTFRPAIDGSSIITMQGSSTSVFIIGEIELNNVSQGNISIPYIFSANYQ